VAFAAVLDGDTLEVAREGAAAEAGRDYELWAIGGDGVPRSLGLLRGAQTVLTSDLLVPGVTLAVSLEPLGGSPAAGPTGPVLAAAVLDEV
jgi:anti-sigma-K factor RskA